MNTPSSNSALAAKFLRESIKVDGAPPSSEARDAAIVAIERAIAARTRRQRVRLLLISAGGVAAAAAVVLGVLKVLPALRGDEGVATGGSVPMLAHPVSGAGATVVGANAADPTKIMPLREGALVSRGQRVTTPADGKIVFAHVTGTELTLNGGSEMAVVEDDQNRIYSLGKGTLDLRVAKLKANERLLVRTSDAEVEVRGTRFHVEVLDPATSCDGRSTRVSVDEGVVVVRRDGAEARLTAGQSWPTCAEGTRTQTQTAPPSSTLAQEPGTQEPGTTPANVASAASVGSMLSQPSGLAVPRDKPQPSVASSTLEEQNDLFAEGIDKKHKGDMAGAAASFDRLLTKFPKSPLVESASAERLKALRVSDPARAKVAAREYLSRWPDGAAHDDALAVLRVVP